MTENLTNFFIEQLQETTKSIQNSQKKLDKRITNLEYLTTQLEETQDALESDLHSLAGKKLYQNSRREYFKKIGLKEAYELFPELLEDLVFFPAL